MEINFGFESWVFGWSRFLFVRRLILVFSFGWLLFRLKSFCFYEKSDCFLFVYFAVSCAYYLDKIEKADREKQEQRAAAAAAKRKDKPKTEAKTKKAPKAMKAVDSLLERSKLRPMPSGRRKANQHRRSPNYWRSYYYFLSYRKRYGMKNENSTDGNCSTMTKQEKLGHQK